MPDFSLEKTFFFSCLYKRADFEVQRFPFVAQLVKNLSAMQETQVRFLGWEDSLEKEMATHSSILAWRIPWTEKPGRLRSIELQRDGHD